MWWQIGIWANAVVAIAYLLIVIAVVRPLVRDKQLRQNALGAATAAIFFTCAVHHGGHVVHMLLPSAHVESAQGLALRASYDWEAAFWDVVTAAVGVYYWSLRRAYAQAMRGASLFEDMRQREREALELNDSVLQGMVVARMALELDQHERAEEALDASIENASRMISDRLGSAPARTPGLLRRDPAVLRKES
jgi:signal transduction histidine kinase